MAITYTGSRGYISAQTKVGAGIIDSVFAGENAIHEPDGWRVFNGWKQIDAARTITTLGYTATLTAGSNIAALSGGATPLADFREFQHVLIGCKLSGNIKTFCASGSAACGLRRQICKPPSW